MGQKLFLNHQATHTLSPTNHIQKVVKNTLFLSTVKRDKGILLGLEDLVVNLVKRRTVGHLKCPQDRAPLLLDLLCL